MNATPEVQKSDAAREIMHTRLVDAARELVFRAFSEPEHMARVWGPKDFRNTFHEFDFRPGGHWRFIMHGPDGTDYPNHNVFLEIVPPERIILRHAFDPDHDFQMTILLEERGGQTQVTWRMLFDTVEKCAAIRPFVTEANSQNLDRLEAEVALMKSSAL